MKKGHQYVNDVATACTQGGHSGNVEILSQPQPQIKSTTNAKPCNKEEPLYWSKQGSIYAYIYSLKHLKKQNDA